MLHKLFLLFVIFLHLSNVVLTDNVSDEDKLVREAADIESSISSRGLLTAIGGGIHEKLKAFCTTIKDILFSHHKKIGGFHFRLKDCFEKIIDVEKKLLNLKTEDYSCPDIGSLVDKVKGRLYSSDYTVSPSDVQSMAIYLQNHLKNLDLRLQQETKYLNLAFEHIKYLQQYYPSHGGYKAIISSPNTGLKIREGYQN